ncbi:MAG: RNase adapter RapZ, partial [Ignavibacteria bacterium]|nr:RNase adapter RapZ [Ignavibacteria bacterium]
FEDLNYFKYYFLRLHPVITVNEAIMDEEFQRFAKFVSDAPADFFMYRDFQSRNILIKDNTTWFIDFQGGRKGPLQYDLVSLLYQVKAQMPQHIRNELIAYYLRMISKRLDVGALKFEFYLPSFVLLRLLQVLGAYGFRGIIQRKNHFLQSIPFALNEMEQLLTFDSLFEPYPELKSVLEQMLQLKHEYQLPESTKVKKLTVRLSSFSYKKGGIPPDQSGNGGGFVFDCRFLPNPGREQAYKMLTGLDKEVIAYLEQEKSVKDFLNDTQKIINEALGTYQNRGFSNLMISFGCTGGQHRSVYCAEKTAQWLQAKFPQVNLIVQHHEQKTI